MRVFIGIIMGLILGAGGMYAAQESGLVASYSQFIQTQAQKAPAPTPAALPAAATPREPFDRAAVIREVAQRFPDFVDGFCIQSYKYTNVKLLDASIDGNTGVFLFGIDGEYRSSGGVVKEMPANSNGAATCGPSGVHAYIGTKFTMKAAVNMRKFSDGWRFESGRVTH